MWILSFVVIQVSHDGMACLFFLFQNNAICPNSQVQKHDLCTIFVLLHEKKRTSELHFQHFCAIDDNFMINALSFERLMVKCTCIP